MNKSYYNILGIDFCINSKVQEIHDSCKYMLYDFISDSPLSNHVAIDVIKDNNNKIFTVCKDGQKVSFSDNEIFKILAVTMYKHALNEIDKKNAITLHSGSVSYKGKGILIVGDSGAGKSTLTIELVANHNWKYLSDEIGLLDRSAIVHPFYKTVSFTPGVVKLSKEWIIKKFGSEYQVAVPKTKYSYSVPLKAIFL